MNYRINRRIGPFEPQAVVTEEQIKREGGVVADWVSIGAVSQTSDQPAPPIPQDRPLTDLENKAVIERHLNNEALRRGKPVPEQEQQEIAARMTAENTDPMRGKRRPPRTSVDAQLAAINAHGTPATADGDAPPADAQPQSQAAPATNRPRSGK